MRTCSGSSVTRSAAGRMRGASKATSPGHVCVSSGFAAGAWRSSNAATREEKSPRTVASAAMRTRAAVPGMARFLRARVSAGRAERATARRWGSREICHGSPQSATGAPPERKTGGSPAAGVSKSRSVRGRDQAFRGHHDPAAVLLADRIDPAQTRHDIALIDLDEAHAAFDERGAATDVAHHPAFDLAGLARRRGHDRAGRVLGRDGEFSAGNLIGCIEGFAELAWIGVRALETLDALADPGELRRRSAACRIDAHLQRRQLDARLRDILLERLDILDTYCIRRNSHAGGTREPVG